MASINYSPKTNKQNPNAEQTIITKNTNPKKIIIMNHHFSPSNHPPIPTNGSSPLPLSTFPPHPHPVLYSHSHPPLYSHSHPPRRQRRSSHPSFFRSRSRSHSHPQPQPHTSQPHEPHHHHPHHHRQSLPPPHPHYHPPSSFCYSSPPLLSHPPSSFSYSSPPLLSHPPCPRPRLSDHPSYPTTIVTTTTNNINHPNLHLLHEQPPHNLHYHHQQQSQHPQQDITGSKFSFGFFCKGKEPLLYSCENHMEMVSWVSISGFFCRNVSEWHPDEVLEAFNDLAVVVSSEVGIIIGVNEGACSLFGYTRSEMMGKPIIILMPHSIAKHHAKYLARYLETGEKHLIGKPRKFHALHQNGSEILVEISLGEVASSYERKFFARFRRVEEEEEVRERERERVVIEREREKEREREEEERSSLTLSSPSSPREGGAMVGRVGVSSFYSSPFSISSILEGVERGRAEKEMRGVMEGLVEGMGGQFKEQLNHRGATEILQKVNNAELRVISLQKQLQDLENQNSSLSSYFSLSSASSPSPIYPPSPSTLSSHSSTSSPTTANQLSPPSSPPPSPSSSPLPPPSSHSSHSSSTPSNLPSPSTPPASTSAPTPTTPSVPSSPSINNPSSPSPSPPPSTPPHPSSSTSPFSPSPFVPSPFNPSPFNPAFPPTNPSPPPPDSPPSLFVSSPPSPSLESHQFSPLAQSSRISFQKEMKGLFHQISLSFSPKDGGGGNTAQKQPQIPGMSDPLVEPDPEREVNITDVTVHERITSDDGKSNVYACTVDGWQCAVKSLSLEGIKPDEVASFVSEIKMLETLPTHRNLVRYLFHETSASTLRLFMRRYYGNLNKYLEKKEELEEVLSLKEMISIGKDIAVGLQVLHSHRIIHRFLVTDNILVTLNGMRELTCCSIGDLASARRLKRKSTRKNGVSSTSLETAAPEALESGISSYAMDVWSLGVILYELLRTSRKEAKQHPPTTSLLSSISTSPLPFPYDENEYKPIVDIMKHCLSLKSKKRPTAEEVRNTLLHLSIQ